MVMIVAWAIIISRHVTPTLNSLFHSWETKGKQNGKILYFG